MKLVALSALSFFFFILKSWACYYQIPDPVCAPPFTSYFLQCYSPDGTAYPPMIGCKDPSHTWEGSMNMECLTGRYLYQYEVCPEPKVKSARSNPTPERTANSCGSIIQIDTQSLVESIKITGVPFDIYYSSQKVRGRKDWYQVPIPIFSPNYSGSGSVTMVNMNISIAGQVISQNFSPSAGLTYNFEWDGKDGSGILVNGPSTATVTINEQFSTVVVGAPPGPYYTYYQSKSSSQKAGNLKALAAEKKSFINYAQPIISNVVLGHVFGSIPGFGGWDFSVHHQYDNLRGVLYLGDGTVQETKAILKSTGDYWVVSKDRSEVFVFDSNFSHKETRYGLTGATKYTFTYNSGKLVEIEDAFGNETTIQYSGSSPISITSPYGQVTNLSTDSNGYINSVTNPESEVYEMTYSTDGLLLTFEKPSGVTSTMTYNADGKLLIDSSSAGSETALGFSLTSLGYNITETSALNRTTTHAIDLTNGFARTDTNSDLSVSKYTSSTAGNWTDSLVSGEERGISYKNDSRFKNDLKMPDLYLLTNAGSSTQIYYNETPIFVDPSDPFNFSTLISTWTQNGNITQSEYTTSLKSFAITTPEGLLLSETINDQEMPVAIQFANLTPITFTYDSHGRIEEIEQGFRATQFVYNTEGFIQTVTNPHGQTTAFTYDGAGRILSQTLPDARTINYTYDSNGNISSITPPSKPTHAISYNGFDLVSSYTPPTISSPSTVSSTYYYNDDRQLIQITKPDSQDIDYNYNSTTGVLDSITFPTGSRSFYYSAGKLSASTSEDFYSRYPSYGGTEITSDYITGNLLSYITSNYFDSFIRHSKEELYINAVTYETNFIYNNDGQLLSVGDESYTRSSTTGFLTNQTLDDVTQDYTYDSSYGELASMTAKYSGATKYSQTFTRDNLGRITGMSENYQGTTNSYVYDYDSTGRLETVTKNGSTVNSYVYDSNSNRTSQTLGGVTTTATYDDQDRLLTFGSKTFTYNLNGEVETMVDGANTTTYVYDVLGNLKSADLPSKTVSYKVDAHNRRMERLVNSVTDVYYIWNSSNQLIGVADNTGALTARFVYGSKAHVPDYMIMGSDKYQIVTNHLGSPVQVIHSTSGVLAQEIKYDEWGRITSDTSPGFTPFGFAGCLYDVDTKLCRFGARDYDANIGRWLSKDPILFAGGDTNLYGYVFQDPINLIDPSGLDVTLYIAPLYHSVIGVTNPNSPTGMTYGDFFPKGNSIGLAGSVPGRVNIGSSYPSMLIPYATYKTTAAQDRQVLQNMRTLRDMANNGSYQYSVVPPFSGALSGQDGNNCFGFSSTACGGVCK